MNVYTSLRGEKIASPLMIWKQGGGGTVGGLRGGLNHTGNVGRPLSPAARTHLLRHFSPALALSPCLSLEDTNKTSASSLSGQCHNILHLPHVEESNVCPAEPFSLFDGSVLIS